MKAKSEAALAERREPSEGTPLPSAPNGRHVLIADDDAISRRLLANKLEKRGYTVSLAASGDEAWDVLSRPDSPRLVVLDWMMPGRTGVDICRALRARISSRYVYIVLVTGKSSQGDIIAGLEAGADDYLKKPYDFAELDVRLRTGQRVLDLEQRLLDAQQALQYQANHDGLTGALNRNAVLGILNQELSRSAREGGSVGIALLDLDHFKAINDCYGHVAGDQVLREAMLRAKDVLRAYDSIGRYGGEEFLAVLPNCKTEETLTVAERLRAKLASEPVICGHFQIGLSASLGIACSVDWPSAKDAVSLVRAADEALYEAKRAGRNRVSVAKKPRG